MNADTRPLPLGWNAQFSAEHGRWYYVNFQASPVTTQWEHPAGTVNPGYPAAIQPNPAASGYVDPSYSGGPSPYAVPAMATTAPGPYGGHPVGRRHATSASGGHSAYPTTASTAVGYGKPHEVADHTSQWGSSHPGQHGAYGRPAPMHRPSHSGGPSDPSSRHNNLPYNANDAHNMSSNPMGSLTNQDSSYYPPHSSPPIANPQLNYYQQPGYTSPTSSSPGHGHGGAPASFGGQQYQLGYSDPQVDYSQTQSGYANAQPQSGYPATQPQSDYPAAHAQAGYGTNAQTSYNQSGYGQDYSGSSGSTMTGYQTHTSSSRSR